VSVRVLLQWLLFGSGSLPDRRGGPTRQYRTRALDACKSADVCPDLDVEIMYEPASPAIWEVGFG
jgi:hypothetical protein